MIPGADARRGPETAAGRLHVVAAADLQSAAPLVVELDELVRVNLEHERLTAFVLARPVRALRLLAEARSLDALRIAAGGVTPDPATVPYDETVLERLHDERLRGRRLVLATDRPDADGAEVAGHLDMFDRVLTRQQLMELGAYESVGPGTACRQGLRELFRSLRPHQWLKNLLVFVALFTAQRIEHGDLWLRAITMFLAFCLVSSSVYVLNDMSDLAADRRHLTKRLRPIASGEVSVLAGWLLWPLLLVCGAVLAVLALPGTACLWLLAYYVGTLAYTFGAKREAVLDVIVLAALYTMRIVAGAAAIGVPASIWLLTFSMSIFTSLALVKRVSELTRVVEAGGVLRGRGYEPRDLGTLKSLGVTASYAAIVVLALYVHDPATARLYETPSLLWLAVPLLLYWSSRLWLLADRGQIDEDPVLFATRDRVSYVVLVATALAFSAAKFIG